MQKIKNHFENQKQILAPSEADFEMILSKIEIKQKSIPATRRSPFMFWSFASVSFAAFILVVVNVVSPTTPTNTKLAINNTTEAINTIDSVKSFDIQSDPNF